MSQLKHDGKFVGGLPAVAHKHEAQVGSASGRAPSTSAVKTPVALPQAHGKGALPLPGCK